MNAVARSAIHPARAAVERLQNPSRILLEIPDHEVERAIELLEASKILDQIAAWRAAERMRRNSGQGGRPESFPMKALLVAMLLAATLGEPMQCTRFRDLLFRRISPAMRRGLGVPEASGDGDRQAWEATYRNVRTRFHSLCDLVDPSPNPKNHRLDADDFEAAVKDRRARLGLTDDVLADRSTRLSWLANALLELSISQLPTEVRERWKGSVAVDATPVPAWARGERATKAGKRSGRTITRYSSDPDAGWYVRHQKSSDPVWAYEASLVVMASENPTGHNEYPMLVVGMAPLHRPAVEPGCNAMRALTSIHQRGHPAGWLTGDSAYTNATPEDFQLPARSIGYEPVLDYREDQLGIQATHAGALLIEGGWYCPAIPKALIEATRDHRNGRITDEEYQRKIEERRKYRLRAKAQPDDEGHQRLTCPAGGHAPTARCQLKPRSKMKGTAGKPPMHPDADLLADPPKICAQATVTFPPEAGAKLAQQLHYQSLEWSAHYAVPRNTIEGVNGFAKDGANEALADASRRRVRGVAAQTLFAAFLLYAANVRKIVSFMDKSAVAVDGIRRRERKARPRRRHTRAIQDFAPDALAEAPATGPPAARARRR